MNKGTPGFNGKRLRQVREARGMSTSTLADSLGVSPQAVSQYELAKNKTPSPEVFETLCTVLGVPASRLVGPDVGLDVGTVFYRSMASTTKVERTRAERMYEWLREAVSIIEETVDFPPVNLPQLDLPSDFRRITNEHLESAAIAVRQQWGLGTAPIPNLVWSMENGGVFVVQQDLWAETIDAFSERSESTGRPFVVLNSVYRSASRHRFNAAHELAHLLLHREVTNKVLNDKDSFRKIEDQAHYFAAALLLPEDTFVKSLYAPTLQAFLAIKPKWNTSISAMIQRSYHLGLIDEERRRKLFMNMSRRRWRKNEPLDDKIPIEQPRMFRRAIEKLMCAGIFDKDSLSFRVGLTPADIERTLGLGDNYLSDQESELDVELEPKIIKFRRPNSA